MMITRLDLCFTPNFVKVLEYKVQNRKKVELLTFDAIAKGGDKMGNEGQGGLNLPLFIC